MSALGALACLVAAAPVAAGGSWWSQIARDIRESEYEITWQERAWHAPNRAQGLRTYFTAAGIRVVPRTEPVPTWQLALSLIDDGGGVSTDPDLIPRGNRIDYRRGAIDGWHVNAPQGLHSGFAIHARPQTTPASLELALAGSLSPLISDDRRAIDFAAPSGAKRLHYELLAATDATGRELPTALAGFAEAGSRGIRIVLDDAAAVYPVTIETLLTGVAWSAEGGQALAALGFSVSTAGDVNGDAYADVIVGAPGYDNGQNGEGRAFVYHGSASGPSSTPDWTAESDQILARFGVAVSAAGDVNGDGYADVIVGADNYGSCAEPPCLNSGGRAFVYHGSPAGLGATASWTADGLQAQGRFGISVSTAGDVNGDGFSDVVVGADRQDHGQPDEGRAFVYHGSAAGLSATPDWTGEGDEAAAEYGTSVSTAGDVNGDGFSDVIVGAPLYDNAGFDSGRVFAYMGSAQGLDPVAQWSDDVLFFARFGASVSTAGDVDGDGYSDVIVGAPGRDGPFDAGAAYLYRGGPGGLTIFQNLVGSGDQIEAFYGASVSAAGDVNGDGYGDVIVGEPGYDNGEEDEGRFRLHLGSAQGLSSSTADWSWEGDQSGARVGVSVSRAGDVNGDGFGDVLVGADGWDGGEEDEGRASLFLGGASGLTESGPAPFGQQAGAWMGLSVADAGDVDGDGDSELIVGAPYYDNGEENEGRAVVYSVSQSGSVATQWVVEGNQAGAALGAAVSTAGDVNGDGYADVIVGAPYYDGDVQDEGYAFVYQGSADGLGSEPVWSAGGGQQDARYGDSVATAGDVNGDGYSDIVVGAPLYDDNYFDAGRAFVYHGSASGPGPLPDWTTSQEDQLDARLGDAVATAGDVNGDGYSDLVVGARLFNHSPVDEGAAFVYHGSATGLAAAASWTAEGEQQSAELGGSVATAGDVNGDGYSDLIVGAARYDNGEQDEGLALVYHGSAAGLSAVADWTAEGDQSSSFFGSSVSAAGDVNGDGFGDVIVGAPLYDGGQGNEGRASAYYGSPAGLSTAADWSAESDQANARFGVSVSSAGDLHGDGFADVVVGANLWGTMDEGRFYVYTGGGGIGLDRRAQQLQPDEDVPIAHLGRAAASDRFRLSLRGISPFGGGRGRLEWEVEPVGTPFDGQDTQVGAGWTDLGGGDVVLVETVDALAAETAYHWRVRLRFDPVDGSYLASRWLSIPHGGWNETGLRTLDADGDGVPAALDCDNAAGSVWSTPGEARSLVVSADKRTVSWSAPLDPGGAPDSLRYDLLRSSSPGQFVAGTDCAATDESATSVEDPATPAAGGLLAWLVRAENDCPEGAGGLGTGSDGQPREGRACP